MAVVVDIGIDHFMRHAACWFWDGSHAHTWHLYHFAVYAIFKHRVVKEIDYFAFLQVQYCPNGFTLSDEFIARINPEITCVTPGSCYYEMI